MIFHKEKLNLNHSLFQKTDLQNAIDVMQLYCDEMSKNMFYDGNQQFFSICMKITVLRNFQ